MAGVRVWWVPDALTYDEEPVTFRQSLVQRRRWCSGVMSVAGRYLPRLWRRVPSRNFFYCLDFAVFLSMPMVQVLALLPGLWAVAQAVLLENWLALALSLASFWGGGIADKTSFSMPSAIKQKEASGRVFVDGFVTGQISGAVSGMIRANVDGDVNLNVISGNVAECPPECQQEEGGNETK